MSASVYLDNSATTKIRVEVLEAMQPFQTECWGNASSMHAQGRQARAAIERARLQVASMLSAHPKEIYFTPSATYSNNQALLGRARYVEEQGLGRHIITSSVEHKSALNPVQYLRGQGWRVTILGVNSEGFINIDELKNAIADDTSIISLAWGNNEIGTIQPIEEVSEIAKSKGIFFHSDAVQIAGKLPLDLSRIQLDSLALSGHKFHAPKGIGVLYLRQGGSVLPLILGGGQEDGLFPGTENVANVVGIGQAAELSMREMEVNEGRLRHLQEVLYAKLARLPGVEVTGPVSIEQRVPGHISLLLKGLHGPTIVEEADQLGVCISSVSACSSSVRHASHVLKAVGKSELDALGSLRITAGVLNSEEECKMAADILQRLIIKANERLSARLIALSVQNSNVVQFQASSHALQAF